MTSLKFHLSSSSPAMLYSSNTKRISFYNFRLPIKNLGYPSLTVHSLHDPPSQSLPPQSQPSILSEYISSVGSPPLSFSTVNLSQWNFSHRHVIILNVIACSVALSATWLFLSAIPTLLAFKRAAESLEKLMDATREELPDTMAAIRLSGMEISDLTMELSDLGQEITQGVKSSTRAVRVAEEKLRGLTNLTPPAPPKASLQIVPSLRTQTREPAVARTARGIKEGIIKGRSMWQMFFTLTRISRIAINYFKKRGKK